MYLKEKDFKKNIYLHKLNFINLQAVDFFSVSPFFEHKPPTLFYSCRCTNYFNKSETCQKWFLGCLRNTTINSEFKNSQLLEKIIINKVRPKVGGKKFCFVISTHFISVKSEIRLNLRVVKQRI